MFEDKIHLFEKTLGTIKIQKENGPLPKVTITLCDASDTYTREWMTQLKKDIKDVHVEYIHVQREYVDVAKKFVQEYGSSVLYKPFLSPDFRFIRIYVRTKSDVCYANQGWESIVQQQNRKQSSPVPHRQSDVTNTTSFPQSVQTSGNRLHSVMCTTKERLNVYVYCDSILNADVDVIVNAANEDLRHYGGVAAIIADAAGQRLIDESNVRITRRGQFKATDVATTSPGRLCYKFILHAIGPRWEMYLNKMDCLSDLKQTIVNVLCKAEQRGVRSIAFPAISAGKLKF